LAAHCLPQVHHVNEPQITKYKLMELQFWLQWSLY
jgi:hypothetical protein